jgi:N-acetylmuramoyl-L-alanine amidase-like protein
VNDTAWHASQVNAHSVGIEHAAVTGTLMATDAQYEASAKLIVWLAKLMNVPIDRKHFLTHWEASPIDNHRLCCTGALDPDRLVLLAQQLSKTVDPHTEPPLS